MRDEKGIVCVPAAAVSVLLLGPGTTLTHRAMELIGDAGVTVIWVGEQGVRYYAAGRLLTTHAQMLMRQAQLVSNTRDHLAVVRKMYQMRFPGEEVSKLTMQQLRGREGSRMRQAHRKASQMWGVPWNGREYRPGEYEATSIVNQALTAGNMCLYGLAHAVTFALGCSTGLGFLHIGHENSFVYDIADLYKAEIVIPLAFELAAESPDDLMGEMRRRTRDRLHAAHVLERMVRDIRQLLLPESSDVTENTVYLWDDARSFLANGINYAGQEDGQ